MATSWDCFDTLVTRRRFDPLSVFDAIGRTHRLDDFTRRRKAAESRAPWTLDSIYRELAKDFGWSPEEEETYKRIEIKAEIEHCCPIQENLNKVKEGDLIVSDMYLPAWAIQRILLENGLRVNAERIVVSTGGKHDGTIWKKLPEISDHIGDNLHSDVLSPRAHGINGHHFTDHLFAPFEDQIGGDMAMLMRVVRLANPYSTDQPILRAMWLEQAWLNIPCLILAALEIPADDVAFMMRDCVHLQPIHEALHGTINHSLHCSRLAFKKGGRLLRQHVDRYGRWRTIVDLQGTGKSITTYWREQFKEDPDLLYVTGSGEHGRVLVKTNHDALERFNSSPLGTMDFFPMRQACEFDRLVVQCQANAVACALSHIPCFSFQRNLELLEQLVSQMLNTVTMGNAVHLASHQ